MTTQHSAASTSSADSPPSALLPLELPALWTRDPAPIVRKSGWRAAAWTVGTIAFMWLMVFALLKIMPSITGRPVRHLGLQEAGRIISMILLFIVGFPIVVLVHEGGHAVGGLLRGWRFESMFIGPLRIMRAADGIRTCLHKVYVLYGGAILMSPGEWRGDEAVRRDFMLLVAAGPLFSLIFGAAMIAALPLAGISLHSAFGSPGTTAVFVIGLMSLAIGLGTLLPIKQGPQLRNDGLQLWLLRARDRNGPRPLDPKIRDAAIRLAALADRPRAWSGELIEQFAGLPGEARRAFSYYRMLDESELERARLELQAMIDAAAADVSTGGPAARSGIAIEAALFEAAWRGDASAATAWLAHTSHALSIDPHGMCLASAAIAAARGDLAAADDGIRQADRAIRHLTVMQVDRLRASTIERVRELLSEHTGERANQPMRARAAAAVTAG